MKTAFISVSNKNGLIDLAHSLMRYEIQLIASKGTATFLAAEGFSVLSIEDYLNVSPLLDGRVKTLHPGIFSGILADRMNPQHRAELKEQNINPIDFVIVDLYPFSQYQDVEHIDIGGVALIRAAAKNHEYCTVVSDANQYELLREELQKNGAEMLPAFKKEMAARAFAKTAQYDAAIAAWFSQKELHQITLQKTHSLSYGENPHQSASFYNSFGESPNYTLLQGKPLSYNNLLDLDAGIRLINEFDQAAAAIIKHTNPCGVALGVTIKQAMESAFYADEKSAFGGIVVLNQPVDRETALFLKPHFIELIAAPEYTIEARDLLAEKSKCRILTFKKHSPEMELRCTLNGFLIQTPDCKPLDFDEIIIPTLKKPEKHLYSDLRFAFQVIRHLKSNSILIVEKGVTVASGMGQTNRVDAVAHALHRANKAELKQAVLASDGFFPFEDSIELISKTPIKTIVQPGGSRRDQEIIDACNRHQISMVMTGIRGFKH
jgi:phosphoribosylaminoimidazolecarboxamide formyltransferase/IMP cyclohydrolase